MFNNVAALFGGINPSNWTDGNAVAHQMSSDKSVLRTLFTQKGYPGANAMVYADNWYSFSSTNGKVVTALFRIRNTTESAINWTVRYHFTCHGGWGELASAALNGVSVFTSGSCTSSQGFTDLVLPVPANRTSTAIFVSTSSPPNFSIRSVAMAFSNNSLTLPAGLEFVDDLETATGGWEQ